MGEFLVNARNLQFAGELRGKDGLFFWVYHIVDVGKSLDYRIICPFASVT